MDKTWHATGDCDELNTRARTLARTHTHTHTQTRTHARTHTHTHTHTHTYTHTHTHTHTHLSVLIFFPFPSVHPASHPPFLFGGMSAGEGEDGGGGGGGGGGEKGCLLVACFTSQQHTSVSQGRICSDNCVCCHTEIEVADQTVHLTQSQYTDTGPTSPSTDPITPGAWQGSNWSANLKKKITGMTRTRKNPVSSGIRTRDLPLSRRTP